MRSSKLRSTGTNLPFNPVIYYSIVGVIAILLVISIFYLTSESRKNKAAEEEYVVQEEVCVEEEALEKELTDEIDSIISDIDIDFGSDESFGLDDLELSELYDEEFGEDDTEDEIIETATPSPTVPGQKPAKTAAPSKEEVTKAENKAKAKEKQKAAAKAVSQALEAKNEEIVGWIKIPGTNINNPVCQTDDNSFYLTHNALKKSSKAGAIFMEPSGSVSDDNVTLYGHHMNNKKHPIMFSELVNYYDKKYASEHDTIYFGKDAYAVSHQYLSTKYKVIAVLKIDIKTCEINYLLNTFQSEGIFNNYISDIEATALITLSNAFNYGDKFLTLSTCDRSLYGASGRCVVIAVKHDEKNEAVSAPAPTSESEKTPNPSKKTSATKKPTKKPSATPKPSAKAASSTPKPTKKASSTPKPTKTASATPKPTAKAASTTPKPTRAASATPKPTAAKR